MSVCLSVHYTLAVDDDDEEQRKKETSSEEHKSLTARNQNKLEFSNVDI